MIIKIRFCPTILKEPLRRRLQRNDPRYAQNDDLATSTPDPGPQNCKWHFVYQLTFHEGNKIPAHGSNDQMAFRILL